MCFHPATSFVLATSPRGTTCATRILAYILKLLAASYRHSRPLNSSSVACLYTIHSTPHTRKIALKSYFFLQDSKKCCTFVPESLASGFRGREVSPLGKPNHLTKHPSLGFRYFMKKASYALCSWLYGIW